MVPHPNVLGPTLYPKLAYNTHILVHTHNLLQIMKSLTAREWGKQKETLMAIYKAVMIPPLEYACCCCIPTPMTLANGGSPIFPLVVHQPAFPSIWPAVHSLRGLSTNPGRQWGAYVGAVEEMMYVVCVSVTEGE